MTAPEMPRALPQLSPELWQLWSDTNGPTATSCVGWDDQGDDGCPRPSAHAYARFLYGWSMCDHHRTLPAGFGQCLCDACRLRQLVAWAETATHAEIQVAVALFHDPAPIAELCDLARAAVAL